MSGTLCPAGHVLRGTTGTPLKGVCPVCPVSPQSEVSPTTVVVGAEGWQMVLAALQALRADLETAGVLSRPDTDQQIVAAIAEAVGSRTFTAAELIEHADTVGGGLAAQLAAGLSGKLTSRGLGKLLARLDGKPFEGLEIRRLGDDRNGAIWAVRPAG